MGIFPYITYWDKGRKDDTIGNNEASSKRTGRKQCMRTKQCDDRRMKQAREYRKDRKQAGETEKTGKTGSRQGKIGKTEQVGVNTK